MTMKPSGVSIVEHAQSKQRFDIPHNHIDWESSGSERRMGSETHYHGSLDHPVLGQIVWNVWEYPVGAFNHDDHDMNGHQLIEDFNYDFSVD